MFENNKLTFIIEDRFGVGEVEVTTVEVRIGSSVDFRIELVVKLGEVVGDFGAGLLVLPGLQPLICTCNLSCPSLSIFIVMKRYR
jgi:hypothetical protein